VTDDTTPAKCRIAGQRHPSPTDSTKTDIRTSTEAETRRIRDSAAAEIRQARADADLDISAARDGAARQVADAEARAEGAEQDATRARQSEAAATVRAEHIQAAAADETARIRIDHQHSLDQLTTATNARITALEETRDALRVRAERAESDLDAARTENQRLAEQLTQMANTEADPEPDEARTPLPRTASRAKKTPAARARRPEA
jgi:chromosome segregation ATPase